MLLQLPDMSDSAHRPGLAQRIGEIPGGLIRGLPGRHPIVHTGIAKRRTTPCGVEKDLQIVTALRRRETAVAFIAATVIALVLRLGILTTGPMWGTSDTVVVMTVRTAGL